MNHRLGLLALFTLIGCDAVGPDYEAPLADLPDAYAWATQAQQRPPGEPQHWWRQFDDPTLNLLVELAIVENYDVRIAMSRIAQYRAQLGIARSQLYPDIGAMSSYARSRTPEEDFSVPGFTLGGEPVSTWRMGVGGSWELDLFGKVARSVESAEGQLGGVIDDWRWTIVTMRADVATGYIGIRTLQARIGIALQGVQVQEQIVELLQRQVHAGTATKTDLYSAQAKLGEVRATLPSLQSSLASAVANLGTLLGMTPEQMDELLSAPGALPTPPAHVAVGVPADLLRRRPDVRAAERNLAAATASVGVATADLYPSLTMNGTFGFGASTFSEMFDWSNHAFNVGPTLSWSLLNGDRVRSTIHQQEAITEQALLSWEQTLLNALSEVEASLVGFVMAAQQRSEWNTAAEQAVASLQLVQSQVEAGVLDMGTLLNARLSLLEVEDSWMQTRGLAAESLVSLYRALGGGWSPDAMPVLPDDKKDEDA